MFKNSIIETIYDENEGEQKKRSKLNVIAVGEVDFAIFPNIFLKLFASNPPLLSSSNYVATQNEHRSFRRHFYSFCKCFINRIGSFDRLKAFQMKLLLTLNAHRFHSN